MRGSVAAAGWADDTTVLTAETIHDPDTTHEALKAWGGKPETFAAGQKAFFRRARFNGLARSGSYSAKHEQEAA